MITKGDFWIPPTRKLHWCSIKITKSYFGGIKSLSKSKGHMWLLRKCFRQQPLINLYSSISNLITHCHNLISLPKITDEIFSQSHVPSILDAAENRGRSERWSFSPKHDERFFSLFGFLSAKLFSYMKDFIAISVLKFSLTWKQYLFP